jgi:8-oxo-dGTP pyrophosphatase MutT (NUDIX family)
LPKKELVNAAARELFEETRLTLTVDDLTMLSSNPVQVPLPDGKYKLVYDYAVSVPEPYVTANLRTQSEVEQDVLTQSTINHDGTYVAPAPIDIDGLPLTPFKTG